LVRCATQLFRNREIWGFDSVLLADKGRGSRGFPTLSVEQTLVAGLRQYVKFAVDKLGLTPPFTVEGGATGVKGFVLHMPGTFPSEREWRPVVDDFVSWRGMLRSTEPAEVDRVLLAIFDALFDGAGHRRPNGLYGFPGPTPGAFPQR
jgi:hypothetical protein